MFFSCLFVIAVFFCVNLPVCSIGFRPDYTDSEALSFAPKLFPRRIKIFVKIIFYRRNYKLEDISHRQLLSVSNRVENVDPGYVL